MHATITTALRIGVKHTKDKVRHTSRVLFPPDKFAHIAHVIHDRGEKEITA